MGYMVFPTSMGHWVWVTSNGILSFHNISGALGLGNQQWDLTTTGHWVWITSNGIYGFPDINGTLGLGNQ